MTMTTIAVEEGSRSPLSIAIDEFLVDVAQKRDDKNPFLKELIQQQAQYLANKDDTVEPKSPADALRSSVERLEKEKGAGRGTRLLAKLSPFIDALQKLMEICEKAVQASPFGVSIAFAGARVVLELANKFQGYLGQIVDAMVTIGRKLKCYEIFAKAYKHSAEVQHLLVNSYKNIIKFWYDASRHLSQSNFRLVMKGVALSLEKDVKKAVEEFHKDSAAVQDLTTATNAEQQRLDRELAQRQDIARWIKGTTNDHVDVRVDFQRQLDRRHKGTCQWILDDQRFKEWRAARENSVLWYNAPPGSGKSVVASTIVEHLQDLKDGSNVVYFFYSFKDPLRQYGIHGLRSLALQLLTLVKTIPDKLVTKYQTEMENHATTLKDPLLASDIITHMLNQCADPVYVVVDGLDECRGVDAILFLNELVRLIQVEKYGLVNWLFTSRSDTGIEAMMQRCEAVEIKAEKATIARDIRTYFSDNTSCQHCIDTWTKNEDNFLYASFICKTIQGIGTSCEDDIKNKLRQYPTSLTEYYIRSLEKLLSKSDEVQELARRTFMILANAYRSMSPDELRDLLAVRTGSQNYAESRVPSIETILELCIPLVEVEDLSRDPLTNSPTIRLCHKTVYDFFNQDPKVISNPDLRKFFATPTQADEELGLNCVTYLQYQRYQEPGLDLTSLLSKKPIPRDHAFLLYAATFWPHHLAIKPQTSATIQAIMEFIKSRAFWTCMSVQSHVTPYVFGTFARGKHGGFNMRAKGSDADNFGLPLPGWLDQESKEGALLDRSFCCFVDEWREVLATCPGGLELCPPLRKFGASCHLTPFPKPKSVRISHVGEVTGIAGHLGEVRLLGVGFRGKNAWADVLCRTEQDGDRAGLTRIEVPLFSKKYKPSQPLVVSIPVDTGDSTWTISALRQGGGPPKIEAWNLDHKTLGLKRMTEDGQSIPEQTMPLSFSQNSTGRKGGAWEVESTQILEPATIGAMPLRILHASWRKQRSAEFACNSRTDDDSDSDTDISEGDSEKPEKDTDDDTESEDDSDLETELQNEEETEAEGDSSETDYESDSGGDRLPTDCLVVIPYSGQPLWHAWYSPPQVWSKVSFAMHPSLPLIAVTHTGRQLEVISVPTWKKTTKHLPETADLEELPPGSLRELRFSPCGSYLNLLSICFVDVPNKAETTAHISLSTFNFNHEGNSSDTLLRKGPSQTCSYSFGECLDDIQTPLALTSWSDREVVVALPPHTCDAKIIRIYLPQDADNSAHAADTEIRNSVWTLQQPIYFPRSTPKRRPCLVHKTDDKDGSGYIYLSLDSLESHTPAEVGGNSSPGLSTVSRPVVLRWKVSGEGGWRAWDNEGDGRASDLKRESSVWNMLKGRFTDTDKSFNVVTRSGTDWKRKGFLSCA